MKYTTITSQEQYEQYKEIRENMRYAINILDRASDIRLLNKLILEWNDRPDANKEVEQQPTNAVDLNVLQMKKLIKELKKKKKKR